MKNCSTPSTPSAMKSASPCRRTPALAPRKSTIFILKQFARNYSCAATLPATLGSMIAN